MELHQNQRVLFRQIKIARGEEVVVYFGDDIEVRHVHWFEGRAQLCEQSDDCPMCRNRKCGAPRETIYAGVWTLNDRRPGLLICSTLSLPWASDSEDVARAVVRFRRASKNNLLRGEYVEQISWEPTPLPILDWMKTLFNSRPTQ